MLRITTLLFAATCAQALRVGCFSGSSETLSQYINNGTYQFQSAGYCQSVCDQSGYNFFALEGGEDCRCGSDLPPITDLIDANNCNIPCPGFALQTCGGQNAFDVYAFKEDFAAESLVSSYAVAESTATNAAPTLPPSSASDLTIAFGPISTAASGSSAPMTTATTVMSSAATVSPAMSFAPSTAVVPSATSSAAVSGTSASASVHTGAGAVLEVQIGLGMMTGLLAMALGL